MQAAGERHTERENGNTMKILTASLAALTLACIAAPTLADGYGQDGQDGQDRQGGYGQGGYGQRGDREGRTYVGCEGDGDDCAVIHCDRDGYECRIVRRFHRGDQDEGRRYGQGAERGGDDYYRDRNFIRCDRDGDDCAVIRCDQDGDECRVVGRFHRGDEDGWRRYGFRWDQGYRDDGGYRIWGDERGQVRCEGDRCWRVR
jgi:hypothetical protein